MWSHATFLEEQVLHAAANARKALDAGFTTLRDAAGGRPELALKHVTDQQLADGARVIVAGFVGMTGGQGDLFTPPAVPQRPYQTADGPDECRKLVRGYARDGVDWIKICTSGGVLSIGDESEWRKYTLEEVQVIVDLCRLREYADRASVTERSPDASAARRCSDGRHNQRPSRNAKSGSVGNSREGGLSMLRNMGTSIVARR